MTSSTTSPLYSGRGTHRLVPRDIVPRAQAFLQQDFGVHEATINELGLRLFGNQFAAPGVFNFMTLPT